MISNQDPLKFVNSNRKFNILTKNLTRNKTPLLTNFHYQEQCRILELFMDCSPQLKKTSFSVMNECSGKVLRTKIEKIANAKLTLKDLPYQ